MARKIPLTIQGAIIGGIFVLLTVVLGWYLAYHWPPREEKSPTVTIETIRGGNVTFNVFPNVKEDQLNEKVFQETLAQAESDKLKALFAAGSNAFQLAKKHSSLKEYDEAIQKFSEALQYLPENSELSAAVHYNLGNVYSAKYEWPQAESAFGETISILEKKQVTKTLSHAYNNLAMCFYSTGRVKEALEKIQKSLKIARDLRDHQGEGATLNNIGAVYQSRGKYTEALDYYKKALPIFKEIGHREGEGTTLNNIGRVHWSLGQYQEALDYYNKALPIRREIGDRAGEGTTLSNIAVIMEKQGNIKEAVELMEKVVEIDKETQNPDLASDTAYLESLRRRLKE